MKKATKNILGKKNYFKIVKINEEKLWSYEL